MCSMRSPAQADLTVQGCILKGNSTSSTSSSRAPGTLKTSIRPSRARSQYPQVSISKRNFAAQVAVGQMAESFIDQALNLVQEHIALAEPIVFALGFAESTVFLSLLVPSSALFLGIGGIHGAAGGQFLSVWLAAATGAAIGDAITFALGRYFKRDIGGLWPLRTRPHWYVLARYYVKRYGVLGVFASKFGGLIRPFVPLVAGAMGMRWGQFLLASPLSCLVWSGTFLAPGYALTAVFS